MTQDQQSDHLAETRAQILAAAIPNVAFDGWSKATLRRAAQDAGIEEGKAQLAFPTVQDMVVGFVHHVDSLMLAKIADLPLDDMRIRDKITAAVEARLDVLAPLREAERRAIAFMALPQHAAAGANCVAGTVDKIWRAIGDTSTDFNFYTKRLTLGGVLSSTVLFWLGDESEDYAETHAFLERRINDVMKIEKAKARMNSACNPEGRPSIISALSRLRYGVANRMRP